MKNKTNKLLILALAAMSAGTTYGQTPQFAAPVSFTLNTTGVPHSGYNQAGFVLEDWDGDGDLDILRITSGHTANNFDLLISFHENTAGANAMPTYPNAPTDIAANDLRPFNGPLDLINHTNLAFVDIDNDGDREAFSFGCYDECTNAARNVSYMEYNGTGYDQGVEDTTGLVAQATGGGGTYSRPYNIFFVDMDDDDDLDYLYPNDNFDVLHFQENIGSPTNPEFAAESSINFPSFFGGMTLIDGDGDGDLDLLGLDGIIYQEAYYYENTGGVANMSFASTPIVNPFGIVGTNIPIVGVVKAVDLDGDGDDDLIATNGDGSAGSTTFFVYENVAGQSTALSATGSVTSNVTCNGGTDGEAMVTGAGGSGTHTYAWSDGQTTATAVGLAAGTYTVTVNDGTNTETATVTIIEPTALMLTEVITNESASGAADGGINLTVTGGTAPYTYAWSNGVTTEDLNNIEGGMSYMVTITDANNCTMTESFSILVGIEEIVHESQYLQLYPNPTQDVLTIKADAQDATVRIYNMMGVMVLEQNVTLEQGQIQLNVTDLATGQYVLELQNTATFLRQQWVKE